MGGIVVSAMRISGGGDPRQAVKDTMKGHVPERIISTLSALGYSSYGNEAGIPTGWAEEFYHPGFYAKRLECGYVTGAVKEEYLRQRSKPKK